MSPDPGGASDGPADPGGWNRYAYVQGDPVNFTDSRGLNRASSELYYVYGFDFCGTGMIEITDSSCGEGGGGGGFGGPCGVGGNAFVPTPGPFCPGEPPPPPQPSRRTSCKISVDTKGTPRDNQNLVGLVPYSPKTNLLGNYSTLDRSGLGPRFLGWFFAVQIQANLSGDTDPTDWEATQTVSTSGTVQIQPLGGPVVPTLDNQPTHPDDPRSYAINQGTTGKFDWLDSPGYGKFQAGVGVVVGADLTKTFTSTLTNIYTGASCSVTWSLHLTGTGNNLSWAFK